MNDALDRTKQAMRDQCDARRCCICQCEHPSFGFGPPLSREPIWACGKHQAEVAAKLRAGQRVDPG
jgi:hypothetical protein